MGVATFFILEVPDYESAMVIYLCVCLCLSVYIRSYNTGRSFDPIFMKFIWLVRVRSWVNPVVFGNNPPNGTTYMGENLPQNQFFGFKSDGMGVFEKKTKNLKTVFGTPFTKKKVIFIFVVRDTPPPHSQK